MNSRATEPLEARVMRAAEAALADHHYVSPIDVLVYMGLLADSQVEAWRNERIPFLEEVIQGHPNKIANSMKIFRDWAQQRGLQPGAIAYLARTSGPPRELRFTKSHDAERERLYRTHFISPDLSEKKQEKLQEKLNRPPELTIFWIVRDSRCSECQSELPKGSSVFMEAGQPLCLTCADLDHLIFLPRGDAALTRRAKKYSPLSAVVVRFSRARKRYERQSLLLAEAALHQAEEECLSDGDRRAARCEREAIRRQEEDQELMAEMEKKIRARFLGCPPPAAQAIASHTAVRGSGRVGRSAAGRALEEGALQAAVVAYIRHQLSNYDELLMEGIDRLTARDLVRDPIEKVLRKWRTPNRSEPKLA